MLIEKYFNQVFENTESTPEIEKLKQEHKTLAYERVDALINTGMPVYKAGKKVINDLKAVNSYREALDLPINRFTKGDWWLFFLVILQVILLMLVYIRRNLYARPIIYYIINHRDKISLRLISFVGLYIIVLIIINTFLLIKTMFFSHNIKSLKTLKIVLIVCGIITLPLGLLTILMGLMITKTRLKCHKYMYTYIWNYLKAPKTKKIGIISITILISILMLYTLTFKVLREPKASDYQISITKICEEPGIQFSGYIRLVKIDEFTTGLLPLLHPSIHMTYFPQDVEVKMNYYINGYPGYESDIIYKQKSVQQPFIINDNINNIIKDVSVVFIFYYEYENEEVRLTYKIEAEDTLELIEIESEETKWIWE